MWQARGAGTPDSGGGESLRTARDVRAAYDRYGGELYVLAFRALRDRTLAESVVRETFVRAWRTGRRFDPRRGPLRAWLVAIARRGTADALRRRPGAALDRAAPQEGRGPWGPDLFDRLLYGVQLDEALRRLSPEHRQAVVGVYRERCPVGEFAVRHGLTARVAGERLYYGVRALHLVLEENGWLI